MAATRRKSAPFVLTCSALCGLGFAAPPTCFEAPVRLSPEEVDADSSFNFKRSLVAAADGSVHRVWHGSLDGRQAIFYQRSLDGGTHWEDPRPLATSEGLPGHPTVAVAEGRVHVAWHAPFGDDFEIRLRSSLDGGDVFGDPVAISGSASRGASHASLAAHGPFVHVVWTDLRSGVTEIFIRSSSDFGEHFTAEQLLSEEPSESWVPAVDAWNALVAVAWVDYRDGNEEEYLRVSRDGGASWDEAVRVTHDAADSWAPSVLVRGSSIFLAWFDRRAAGLLDGDVEDALDEALALLGIEAPPPPSRDPEVYYLPLFLDRIEEKQAAVFAAAPSWIHAGGDPSLLEAQLGEFERRYERWAKGWAVLFTRSPDLGRSWEPVRVISESGPARRPSLALADGDLHIAWFDGRHGTGEVANDEIYYRHSPDFGDRFGPEQRVTHAPGASLRPMVAALPGRVILSWMDERFGNPAILSTTGILPEWVGALE